MAQGRLLTGRAITVRFGATIAVDAVDIALQRGEVHAVVGENGAGKSTLLRVLAGVLSPHSGTVETAAPVRLAWVPQEPTLPPDLTAEEWIFLGREICGPFGWLRRSAMHAGAAAVLHSVGSDVSPQTRLGSLPWPQRKQVQLARAVSMTPDVLLLDEPTAVLGDAETRELFRVVAEIKQRGAAILYVSHRLDEVLAIADRVTVLRDGRRVSSDAVGVIDTQILVARMVGRDVQMRERDSVPPGGLALRVIDLAAAHVDGISFTAHQREIVGLAGLVGAGRSEVLEAIAGLLPLRSGRVACTVRPVLVPEDRGSKGLIPTFGLRDNLFLPAEQWRLFPASERRIAESWIERLAIRAAGTEAPIASLSGGNQQKLLLARALRQQPQLLLLDEPTAGIDVGAKAEIHDLIRRLAAEGTAIVLASSDLSELLMLCDRILALRAGQVVGSLDAAAASERRLAALITGAEPGATPSSH